MLAPMTAIELSNLPYRYPASKFNPNYTPRPQLYLQNMSVTFQYADPPLVNDILEYHTTTSRLKDCTHTICQATVVSKIIPFPDSDSKSENCTVTSKTCIIRLKDNILYSLIFNMCCPRISKYYLLTSVYPAVYLSREYTVVSRKLYKDKRLLPPNPYI